MFNNNQYIPIKNNGNIINIFQIQFIIVSIFLLLIFKLFIPQIDFFLFHFINDLLVVFVTLTLILNFSKIFKRWSLKPIPILISLIIANALSILIFNLSDSFFNLINFNEEKLISSSNYFYEIILFGYVLTLLVISVYIFIVYRHFFFLSQTKNLKTYFNTFVIFIFLSGITQFLDEYDNLKFINITFTVVAIIIIIFNSNKTAWIAFLNKKQKQNLMFISILLLILFGVNIGSITSDNFYAKSVEHFSPFIKQFTFLMDICGVIYFLNLLFTTIFHLPTAEAIDRKTKEISSLQYFSKLINQVLDYDDLLNTIKELSLQIVNADISWLLLNENEKNILYNQNIGYLSAEKISEHFLKNINSLDNNVITVLGTKINNAISIEEKINQIVCVPLKSHNKNNGYLFIARKNELPFDDEDKKSIETFAYYASIAIENSKLMRESIEKERMKKELEMARDMQQQLLPASIPQFSSFDISAMFIPANEVGGDYYDIIKMDDGKFYLAIGDVSGKGVSAALLMANLQAFLKSICKQNIPLEDATNLLNQLVSENVYEGKFITFFWGIFDNNERTIEFVNAGHNPPLLINNEFKKYLSTDGMLLGVQPNLYRKEKLLLQKGDLLIFYTDGVTEAKNINDEEFSCERLEKLIMKEKNSVNYFMKTSDEILFAIKSELEAFTKGQSQSDDITCVVIKVN